MCLDFSVIAKLIEKFNILGQATPVLYALSDLATYNHAPL